MWATFATKAQKQFDMKFECKFFLDFPIPASQAVSLIYELTWLARIGKSEENLLKTSFKVTPETKVAHIFWWHHDNQKQSASLREHWCDVSCAILDYSIKIRLCRSNTNTCMRRYPWQHVYEDDFDTRHFCRWNRHVHPGSAIYIPVWGGIHDNMYMRMILTLAISAAGIVTSTLGQLYTYLYEAVSMTTCIWGWFWHSPFLPLESSRPPWVSYIHTCMRRYPWQHVYEDDFDTRHFCRWNRHVHPGSAIYIPVWGSIHDNMYMRMILALAISAAGIVTSTLGQLYTSCTQ